MGSADDDKVTYAISALCSALGDNRLMPRPELDCILINADSGYGRTNYSWILSRILRDFDFWRRRECDEVKEEKLAELRADIKAKRERLTVQRDEAVEDTIRRKIEKDLKKLPADDEVRIALRVTVWQCTRTTCEGSGDMVYWIGLFISSLQLAVAAVPWIIHGEWYTFLVTASGTLLAYASGALPQWFEEKYVSRRLKKSKSIFLTEGNGAEDIILILAGEGDMDLEALAAPQRQLRRPWTTRILCAVLATLWVCFLITVAGWEQRTWYLLGVGMIGMLHNVGVAGLKRQPRAWGIDLQYKDTIVDGKVMGVLYLLEKKYPQAGCSLKAEFFPGNLFPREELLWAYAKRRHHAWQKNDSPRNCDGTAKAWAMPDLDRPESKQDDKDIPDEEEYKVPVSTVNGDAVIDVISVPGDGK